VGVFSKDDLLNNPIPGIGLGEISIPLRMGITSLELRGNGVFPYNPYYGAVLFFDGQQGRAANRRLQR